MLGLLPDGMKPHQPSRAQGAVRAPTPFVQEEKKFNKLKLQGYEMHLTRKRPKVEGLP